MSTLLPRSSLSLLFDSQHGCERRQWRPLFTDCGAVFSPAFDCHRDRQSLRATNASKKPKEHLSSPGITDSPGEAISNTTSQRKRGRTNKSRRANKTQHETMVDRESSTSVTNRPPHGISYSDDGVPTFDTVRHVENAEEMSGVDLSGLLMGRLHDEKESQITDSVDTKKKKKTKSLGRGRGRAINTALLDADSMEDIAHKDERLTYNQQDEGSNLTDRVMEETDTREIDWTRLAVMDRRIKDEPEETKINGENGKMQQEENMLKGKRGRTSRRRISRNRKEIAHEKAIAEAELLDRINEGCLAMATSFPDGKGLSNKGELNASMEETHSSKSGRKENITDAHSSLGQELEKEALSCLQEELNSGKIISYAYKSEKSTIPLATSMDIHEKFPTGKVKQRLHSSKGKMELRCTVTWIVAASLTADQKLFVTGSSPFLGAWEPSKAIPLSSHEEVGNLTLWNGQAQVPSGMTSEYDYFIKVVGAHSETIIWRPGSRFLLHVPSSGRSHNEMLVIKDTLDFTVVDNLLCPSWGTWWKELGIPPQLSKATGYTVAIPEVVVKQSPKAARKDSAEFVNRETGASKISSTERTLKNTPVDDIDHTFVNALQERNFPLHLSSTGKEYLEKKVMPREEPWLMETIGMDEKLKNENRYHHIENQEEAHRNHLENSDVLESSLLMERRLDVPTEILINSSECTMERIAILEEGKLVELLLEPVDSEVRVGNVYLGVVKKLLPGMTGVFVDIGAPRTALLSIKKNRYPYTFPPLNSQVGQSDGSMRSDSVVNSTDHGDDDANGESHYLLEEEHLLDDEQMVEDTEDDDESTEEEELVEDELEGNIYEDISKPCTTDMVIGGEETSETNFGNLGIVSQDEEIQKFKKHPLTVNFGRRFTRWRKLEEGMKIIVQVRREPLGKKGSQLSAFPNLSSRFWVLIYQGDKIPGVSKRIIGPERRRLKRLAESFKPPGFGLTARTEAAGQPSEELEKDFTYLLDTWRSIEENAEATSVAAEGDDSLVPMLLHRAMGQTLSVVRDFFVERVQRMVVDSSQTYQEVTEYLEGVAPHLLNRVEFYTGKMPIFDAFNLEPEIEKFLSKRVELPNGAYLVIEETEALVSIDVNGGIGIIRRNATSATILEVNLIAAQQIARHLRLRDIGGIIIIDFIDMNDSQHEKMVYEEMRKAIQYDRSLVKITEISELGVMELTRKKVRPSVTFMISDSCSVCHGTGRVEGLETTLCKIERAILRFLANNSEQPHVVEKTWPKILLRVDPVLFDYLTKRKHATRLSSYLKVYLVLKVGRELSKGQFEVSELTVGVEKRHASDGQMNAAAHNNGRSVPISRRAHKAR